MGLSFERAIETVHMRQKCAGRRISIIHAKQVAQAGEIIREYPDERPYPCYLVLGWVEGRPLHVLDALDAPSRQCILVTAYWPDPAVWEADFRRKRTP
jgi:hypothetical protein